LISFKFPVAHLERKKEKGIQSLIQWNKNCLLPCILRFCDPKVSFPLKLEKPRIFFHFFFPFSAQTLPFSWVF